MVHLLGYLEKLWVVNLIPLMLHLVHYIHNVTFHFADSYLLGALVLRVLWDDKGEVSAILREFHHSAIDALKNKLFNLN